MGDHSFGNDASQDYLPVALDHHRNVLWIAGSRLDIHAWGDPGYKALGRRPLQSS
ncbi:hypothetical protein GGI1_21724 [Acidithiobacillus sp. GGI-221]|nr:hypothetical protein GGI1_21724 [Acidithiobacillus sp. GGI-221]